MSNDKNALTAEEAQKIADGFDGYFAELGLDPVHAPIAFAAWMHNETGWDGKSEVTKTISEYASKARKTAEGQCDNGCCRFPIWWDDEDQQWYDAGGNSVGAKAVIESTITTRDTEAGV